MTPALVALARAYLALPGAPTPRSVRFARDVDGMMWVLVPDESGRLGWVIDLTAPAAGGVMLGLLPVAVKVVTRTEPRSFRLMWLAEDGEGLGPRQHTTPWLDTLAEAVARVAVAVGRAG